MNHRIDCDLDEDCTCVTNAEGRTADATHNREESSQGVKMTAKEKAEAFARRQIAMFPPEE